MTKEYLDLKEMIIELIKLCQIALEIAYLNKKKRS